MPQYRALRTFGNKTEGKRVRLGTLLTLTEARAKTLNSGGIKLVEAVVVEAGKLEGEAPLEGKRARRPISRQIYPTGRPEPVERRRSKARTAEDTPRRPKQDPEPPAPARASTSRGGRSGAAKTDASSSQAAPAPSFPTSRARGNRTPKPAGSPSTTPTD